MVAPARARDAADGVILVDKPSGLTSHDVVAATRRQLGRSVKVGHAGTLDPFATGLLLVLVGRATRVQRFLMALPKRYETVARLGWTSTTGDRDGELAPGQTPPEPWHMPTGVIRQRPPAFSAVKVDGVRAYEHARRGEPVTLAEREVRVDEFAVSWHDGDHAAFEIACSSGTYVRALIAGLGDAYCRELRRTAIGHFDVADADPERIVSLEQAIAFLPEVRLSPDAARRAGHGQAVADPLGLGARPPVGGEEPSARAEPDATTVQPLAADVSTERPLAPDVSTVRPLAPDVSTVRLLDADGLIALAEPRDDGLLKPVVGFRG